MDTLSYKTVSVNKQNADKKWLLVDAEGKTLGRLSSEVAKHLRGKYKPSFTPHADCGDNVIIINAEKIKLSGEKLTQKKYVSHSGYPGGQKITTPAEILEKNPKSIVERAIKGMLPKNRLGREVYRNLFVYEGTEHPHEAQKPTKLELN
ncbi:MAG: 50S ribosomal protein L13 [Flavobacteriales bacterium]|nr:50S ribosomal protein L13 [Flavobacteriales bacterium]